MPKKKITEEVRLALKRQAAESDIEGNAQTQESESPNPGGNRQDEGSGNPGGGGRGGKASRG